MGPGVSISAQILTFVSMARAQLPNVNSINNLNLPQVFFPDSVSTLGDGRTNTGQPNYVDLNVMATGNRFIDRRVAEGWWNLYPFGEMYFDREILEQPSHDTQIDLDFYFPFYGFRFNYTFIIPSGILAFSRPQWIQPPYTFPNPRWPYRKDPSFVAPFFADANFQYIGETGISHVWYRTVHRARFGALRNPGNQNAPGSPFASDPFNVFAPGFQDRQFEYGQGKRISGYVEDDYLLDNITMDIQNGIIGAQGFTADHALIVTWERMAYGGSPKIVDTSMYDQARASQNTYQVVLASDEIRSYVILNYGTLNWTASTEAGALHGRGGRQSAITGFNGGNGTGFIGLPYNGEGEVYKLARYSSGVMPGRWVYRVDEQIVRGGCNNESIGEMTVSPTFATMLGGLSVNISGPCIRPGDQVVAIFDQFAVNCEVMNPGRARCVLPTFFRIGMVDCKFSRDGGQSFPYFGVFYILQPDLSEPLVQLERDVVNTDNNFINPDAQQLTIRWSPFNLTTQNNARVNIELWGYWENLEFYTFRRVGILAEGHANDGRYSFAPSSLSRSNAGISNTNALSMSDAWKYYKFGAIRVSQITADREQDLGNIFYSHLTPFAWYFKPQWQFEHGANWALDMCIEWFEYDGRRNNFAVDLEPCPCVLEQALLDQGRFMPVFSCNMQGDSACPYHNGAKHCVMSNQANWMGSQQVCCYDTEGWLMQSDDYEYTSQALRYFSPGTPYRSSFLGAYPYRVPPYVPSMSNYFNDLMPYHLCCKYAEHCQFYFWRRQSNGCINYRPPGAGFAYGDPHFITFDGVRYTFNGKGYFVLAMSDHPWHKLMVQIRLEQPPPTQWGSFPNATVITGVAIQENDSDVVQILARKEFRRWRYRTDVLVRGVARYFDRPEWKYQVFKGVSIYNPARNMNQSELIVQLNSGVGVRVTEAHGILDVMVLLPPSFNRTSRRYWGELGAQNSAQLFNTPVFNDGREYYQTMGLLGVYDNQPQDDFYTLESHTSVLTPQRNNVLMYTESEQIQIYYQFAQKWRITGSDPRIGGVLFQTDLNPIYNPLLFARNDADFTPEFSLRYNYNSSARLLFTDEQVRSSCKENIACRYDYLQTGRREIALNTLDVEQKFLSMVEYGTKQLTSCGSLLKGDGVIKHPVGNNYLDGVTVSFDCEPEYFLHGTKQRTCINGTWTPGWYVWCRTRSLEYFLKWITGLITSAGIIIVIVCIFFCCYWSNVRPKHKNGSQYSSRQSNYESQTPTQVHYSSQPPPGKDFGSLTPDNPYHLTDTPFSTHSYGQSSPSALDKPVPSDISDTVDVLQASPQVPRIVIGQMTSA